MTKARKYSRKNIRTTPKTPKQYQKACNQTLWRKWHATRETLGLTVAQVRAGFASETPVLTHCEALVNGK